MQPARRVIHRTFTVLAMGLVSLLLASASSAQEDAGAVFQALANVDVNLGNVGSAGCGGAGAVELSEALGGASSQGGLDDNQRPVEQRRALFRFCDIQTSSTALGWTGNNGVAPEQLAGQATALAPEELFAGMDGANASYNVQAGNVARRLSVLRLARRGEGSDGAVTVASRGEGPFETRAHGFSFGAIGSEGLALALQDGIQGGAPEEGALGFFVNGRVLALDGDGNDRERGSDSVGGGFTLGVDTRLGGSGFAGGAFGYTRVDTSYDRSGSEASLDAYTFSLYGSMYPTDQMYVDLSLTGSYFVYDSENEVIVFDNGPPIEAIEGDTDGGSIGAELAIGFDIPIEAMTLSPYGRLSVLYTTLDDFKQTGGDGSLDIALDEQESTSLTTHFGAQLGYTISTKVAVLAPYVRAGWVHEFLDESDNLTGSLEAVSGAGFRLRPPKEDEDYANFGVGMSATFGQGFSQFVDYDVIALHKNLTAHQVTVGLRMEF